MATLLIAPCDNGMYWDSDKFQELIDLGSDIICWTFTKQLTISDSVNSWGYVSVDNDDNIMDVSVKKPMTKDPYSEQCVIGTFGLKMDNCLRI